MFRRVIAPKFDTKECAKMKRWTRMLAILLSLMMLLSLSACGEKPADPLVRELLGDETMAIVQKDYPSPLEYYRAVEQRRAQELMSIGNLAAFTTPYASGFSQADMTVRLDQSALSQDLLDLVTESVGFDLSWFKSLGIGFTMGQKETLGQANIVLRLNDTDLIDLTGILDRDAGKLYLSVPLLNAEWMGLDLEELAVAGGGALADAGELASAMNFTPEELSALVTRYHELLLNSVEKVDVAEGSVTAGGIENKCSIASVKLEGEDLLRVAKVFVDAAAEDPTVEKLVFCYEYSSGAFTDSFAYFHEHYLDLIAQAREKLENTTPADMNNAAVAMEVYIDAKGEILGRRLDLQEEGESKFLLSYLTARDGDKLGLEAEFASADEESAKISGSGTLTQEGKLDGSFLISAADPAAESDGLLPIFTANVDGTLGKEGFLGDLELIPTPEVLDKLVTSLEDSPAELLDLVRSLTLFVSNNSAPGKLDLRYSIRTAGKDLLTVSATGSAAEPFAITVPEDAVDPNTWASSLGFATISTILNKLMEAGVPSSLINGLMG